MYYNQHLAVDSELIRTLTEKQRQLSQQVLIQKPTLEIKTIAGCDSSFIGDNILSVFVVLDYTTLEILEKQWHYGEVELPYIPGLLAFREAPNLMKAYAKLQLQPDVIMVDGHGISHPRRMGIASHLGVHLQKPTMGLAKNILAGKFEEPAAAQGSISPVIHRQEHIANAIRTKEKVKAVFASAGHLLDLETATQLAFATTRKYKLPEPTRLADHYAEVLKKEVRG